MKSRFVANRLWALFKSARLIVPDVAQYASGVCPHRVELVPVTAVESFTWQFSGISLSDLLQQRGKVLPIFAAVDCANDTTPDCRIRIIERRTN